MKSVRKRRGTAGTCVSIVVIIDEDIVIFLVSRQGATQDPRRDSRCVTMRKARLTFAVTDEDLVALVSLRGTILATRWRDCGDIAMREARLNFECRVKS